MTKEPTKPACLWRGLPLLCRTHHPLSPQLKAPPEATGGPGLRQTVTMTTSRFGPNCFKAEIHITETHQKSKQWPFTWRGCSVQVSGQHAVSGICHFTGEHASRALEHPLRTTQHGFCRKLSPHALKTKSMGICIAHQKPLPGCPE